MGLSHYAFLFIRMKYAHRSILPFPQTEKKNHPLTCQAQGGNFHFLF